MPILSFVPVFIIYFVRLNIRIIHTSVPNFWPSLDFVLTARVLFSKHQSQFYLLQFFFGGSLIPATFYFCLSFYTSEEYRFRKYSLLSLKQVFKSNLSIFSVTPFLLRLLILVPLSCYQHYRGFNLSQSQRSRCLLTHRFLSQKFFYLQTISTFLSRVSWSVKK